MTTVDNVIAMQTRTECWDAVPNFKYLEASTLGRVRTLRRPTTTSPFLILSPGLSSNGYLTVDQADDRGGARRTRYIHDLVAAAFIGPKPAGQIVMHKNDVKTDNRAENIVYGTYGDNLRDAYKNGRRFPKRGPRNVPVVTQVDDLPLAA